MIGLAIAVPLSAAAVVVLVAAAAALVGVVLAVVHEVADRIRNRVPNAATSPHLTPTGEKAVSASETKCGDVTAFDSRDRRP